MSALNVQMKSFIRVISSDDWSVRKPSMRLIMLLNQYHSIGMMYASDEAKEEFTGILSDQIEKVAALLPYHIQQSVPFWIASSESWAEGREHIFY